MKFNLSVLPIAFLLSACGGGGSSSPTVVNDTLTVQTDQFDRILSTNKLAQVACPQAARAIFIAGQSNAANHSQNTLETTSPYVLQYFEGNCYIAQSPILGGTGTLNNPFQAVMVDYQQRVGGYVVYSVFAVGGQPITKFSANGIYNEALQAAYADLNNRWPVKYFLWQQGESDAANRISAAAYTNSWSAMVSSVGISVPMLARSTHCLDLSPYDTEVGRAQDILRTQLGGPDTDLVVGTSERWDACHFGTPGVAHMSQLWNQYLN